MDRLKAYMVSKLKSADALMLMKLSSANNFQPVKTGDYTSKLNNVSQLVQLAKIKDRQNFNKYNLHSQHNNRLKLYLLLRRVAGKMLRLALRVKRKLFS